jgi:hypothetical protein
VTIRGEPRHGATNHDGSKPLHAIDAGGGVASAPFIPHGALSPIDASDAFELYELRVGWLW